MEGQFEVGQRILMICAKRAVPIDRPRNAVRRCAVRPLPCGSARAGIGGEASDCLCPLVGRICEESRFAMDDHVAVHSNSVGDDG